MGNLYCQSCGMPMNSEEMLGTNKDESLNTDYCTYCYKGGKFTQPNLTMEDEIRYCIPFIKKEGMSEKEARKMLEEVMPKLKRWRVNK